MWRTSSTRSSSTLRGNGSTMISSTTLGNFNHTTHSYHTTHWYPTSSSSLLICAGTQSLHALYKRTCVCMYVYMSIHVCAYISIYMCTLWIHTQMVHESTQTGLNVCRYSSHDSLTAHRGACHCGRVKFRLFAPKVRMSSRDRDVFASKINP